MRASIRFMLRGWFFHKLDDFMAKHRDSRPKATINPCGDPTCYFCGPK